MSINQAEAAKMILAEMERMYTAHRLPEVAVHPGGETEITYKWSSPVIEEAYNQLVKQLAELSNSNQ